MVSKQSWALLPLVGPVAVTLYQTVPSICLERPLPSLCPPFVQIEDVESIQCPSGLASCRFQLAWPCELENALIPQPHNCQ